MQRSLTPTTDILITAATNSDYDEVSFVTLTVDTRTVNWLQEAYKAVAPLNDIQQFAEVSFYLQPDGYFKEKEEDEEEENILAYLEDSGEDWSYIVTNDNEIEHWPRPQSELDCHTLKIDAEGNARFSAYSKRGGDEFFSREFPLLKIVKEILDARVELKVN